MVHFIFIIFYFVFGVYTLLIIAHTKQTIVSDIAFIITLSGLVLTFGLHVIWSVLMRIENTILAVKENK